MDVSLTALAIAIATSHGSYGGLMILADAEYSFTKNVSFITALGGGPVRHSTEYGARTSAAAGIKWNITDRHALGVLASGDLAFFRDHAKKFAISEGSFGMELEYMLRINPSLFLLVNGGVGPVWMNDAQSGPGVQFTWMNGIGSHLFSL